MGVFLTTYTYLNTILDGEQPLVISSKHTVTNTVTAPDDYLSLLQPPKRAAPARDTNTYYSTVTLEKTLFEDQESRMIKTSEVMTQVVITESIPSKATSVMTSYIALDFNEVQGNSLAEYSTTDVVKTYYVTYTYYNTILNNGQTVVETNVSTSSDVVTEKLFFHPRKTHTKSIINTAPIGISSAEDRIDKPPKDTIEIQATKTYVTTFTYFTTLLQEHEKLGTSTVINSHTREFENVVTETVDPSLLDKRDISSIRKAFQDGTETLTRTATLHNGQKIEVTAVNKEQIKPSKVLPIEKTQMVELETTSTPSVITGSTIIFFEDDDPFAKATPTPTPAIPKITKTVAKPELNSLLSSEIVKRSTTKSHSKHQSVRGTKTKKPSSTSVTKNSEGVSKNKTATSLALDSVKKKTNPAAKPAGDLLGLGSINMNTLHALKPVINAMAGLIKTNLKGKRTDSSNAHPAHSTTPRITNPFVTTSTTTSTTTTTESPDSDEVQNRSPIYIPLGDAGEGLEIAESQNVATIHIQEQVPLLNGGIPISPGEVITANSDVIVGKPGLSRPRIPAVPMEPPPVLPKTKAEVKKDQYFGPPSFTPQKIPLRSSNFIRGEKYKVNTNINKRIPLSPPTETYAPTPKIPNFVLTKPHVLPEVIERSTGQPLLVNLQPSQVAVVNIPHNRTTALIFGGSTEPHRSGQYFDDPLPYPDQKFSFSATVDPHFSNRYNQKQVEGMINVINTRPLLLDRPTEIMPKPTIRHDLRIHAPPISFGMIHQGNDFNAHIINHGDILFSPPAASFEVKNAVLPELPSDLIPPRKNANDFSKNLLQAGDLSQFLTPPQVTSPKKAKKPERNQPTIPPPSKISRPQLNLPSLPKVPEIPPPSPHSERKQAVTHKPIPIPLIPEDEDGDDYINEDGEVIQESNSRPLRPGQVPAEIAYASSTPSVEDNRIPPLPVHPQTINTVNFGIQVAPPFENQFYQHPMVQDPRPFDVVVRPENQVGNQIITQTEATWKKPVVKKPNGFRYGAGAPLVVSTNMGGVYNNRVVQPHQRYPIEKQQNTQDRLGGDFPRPKPVVPVIANHVPGGQERPQVVRPLPSTIQAQPQPILVTQGRPLPGRPQTQGLPQTKVRPPQIPGAQGRPQTPGLPQTQARPPQVHIPQVKPQAPTQSQNQGRPARPQVVHVQEHVAVTQAKPFKPVSVTVPTAKKRFTTPRPPVTSTSQTPLHVYYNSSTVGSVEIVPLDPKRPYVTSMPVNPQNSPTSNEVSSNTGSQTEAPFGSSFGGSSPSTIKEDISGMKPPPMPEPATSMQPPPQIEIHTPGGGIHRVPNLSHKLTVFDLDAQASSPTPFVPNISEEMIPPKSSTSEEVLGMSPPAPATTHRPIPNVSTQKPVFSLEIDPVTLEIKPVHPYTFETTPTSVQSTTKRRFPFSRRPLKRKTTTTVAPLTRKTTVPAVTTRRATYHHILFNRTRTTTSTTEAIESKRPSTAQSTTLTSTTPTSTTTPKPDEVNDTSTTVIPLHHEINRLAEEEKPSLPTRYITHTKTSTVTITKTTVVKAPGGPPSTMTLLVTKTEKSTKVDTVTEFHTLVKPTSIVETITTTINHLPTTLYPPDVGYGQNYGSINPTPTLEPTIVEATAEPDLEEFIIRDTDPPVPKPTSPNISTIHVPADNDSIFVVLTDKKSPSEDGETQTRDEQLANEEANRILLGGILIASPPSLESPKTNLDRCEPECKASKNELCQKIEAVMRCVCRPGFARMFPDRPCKRK